MRDIHTFGPLEAVQQGSPTFGTMDNLIGAQVVLAELQKCKTTDEAMKVLLNFRSRVREGIL